MATFHAGITKAPNKGENIVSNLAMHQTLYIVEGWIIYLEQHKMYTCINLSIFKYDTVVYVQEHLLILPGIESRS